jgi:hypothetical protein
MPINTLAYLSFSDLLSILDVDLSGEGAAGFGPVDVDGGAGGGNLKRKINLIKSVNSSK